MWLWHHLGFDSKSPWKLRVEQVNASNFVVVTMVLWTSEFESTPRISDPLGTRKWGITDGTCWRCSARASASATSFFSFFSSSVDWRLVPPPGGGYENQNWWASLCRQRHRRRLVIPTPSASSTSAQGRCQTLHL